MTKPLMLALLAATVFGLQGCGDGGEGEGAGEATGEQSSSAVDTLKDKVRAAADSASETGEKVAAAAAAASDAAGEKGQELSDAVAEQGGMIAETANAQAAELIDKLKNYLAENDVDSARGILEKLAPLKESLPESLQTQIEALQRKLATMIGGAETAG
ncbi:MAG: hypothetical protein K9M02_22220 [Thiohalocapsa sp.]|nr:hypothetical protein [Thiohalocapsa sp.]